MRIQYGNGTQISFLERGFSPSEVTQTLISGGALSEGFNNATLKAPARGLLKTAPHLFTDRGYTLEQIETILDYHAYYGAEPSHGTFMAAMDLADAHWAILEDEKTPGINLVDRVCEKIPKPHELKDPKAQSMSKSYWDIHEAIRTIPGVGMSKLNPEEGQLLLILASRNMLNSFRGTFTAYAYKNTEGIENDMIDFWINPARSKSKQFRNGEGAFILSGTSKEAETFRYGDAGKPSSPKVI